MKTRSWIVALALVTGCADSGGGADDDSTGAPNTSGATDPTTGDEPTGGDDETKVPPVTGHDDIQAWLAEGHYKNWKCETGVQEPISISPHGKQRICSNGILSAHGEGEYPVDSSAVKEIYDAAGAEIVGYAVYRHTKAGTDGGSWYWYEQLPIGHPDADDKGVVADGYGDAGKAMSICVNCHQATGIDMEHPGHDFVYEQIK